MGCEPGNLTGFVPLAQGRETFERAWGVKLPAGKGLNLMQMMEAAREKRLKALWCIGYDVLLTNPTAPVTREALRALDFLVVSDMFLCETAKEAAVFLPVASSFEKDGTFMSGERRIQRVRKAVEPPGEAKADWEIIRMLARAMGRPREFAFGSAEEIWNEVRTVWKVGAGISYSRLEGGGIQWPCTGGSSWNVDPPRRDVPWASVVLWRIAPVPSPEAVSDEYPWTLITGDAAPVQRRTMTGARRTTCRARDARDFTRRRPEAQRRGRPACARGELARGVRAASGISQTVRPGELFATFHTAEAFINWVIKPYRDPPTDTPNYKVTAVRVCGEKASSLFDAKVPSRRSRSPAPLGAGFHAFLAGGCA